MTYATKLVFLALGAAITGYVGWWAYRVTHYAEWVSLISIGDPEAKVRAVVGRPVVVNSSPEPLWCSAPGMSYEYMYGTSIVASWDVVGFNKHGKVVCKQALQSP